MPEFTALQLALLVSVLGIGIGAGWLLRSDRCAREKIAVNAGWQEQLEQRQAENDRLGERNRELERQLADAEVILREREGKIQRLRRQVGHWRKRLPPLVERYREREGEVRELRSGLERANERIAQLEGTPTEAPGRESSAVD